jgi:chitinase
MEIVGGDGIRCVVKDIIQKEKNLIAEVNQKSHDEVVGYWHELYNPPEDARRYGLRKNHCARLIARSVVRVARRLKSRPSR